MSKKKKPSVKRGPNDTIAQRYQNISENMVENIIHLSELDHVTISIVKSLHGDAGRVIDTRINTVIRKEDSATVNLPGSTTRDALVSKLGNLLRNADKDEFQYTVLAAFFKGRKDLNGKIRLEQPERVYQWLIKDKTLTPAALSGDEWNQVPCIAGPVWEDNHFVNDIPVALDPEDFTDEEITSAGLLVTRFFEGIIAEAPVGVHKIISSSSAYTKPATIVFHKGSDSVISAEQHINETLSLMSAMIIRAGNFSTTLHSFIDEDINDSEGLMRADSVQELRAWAVSTDEIYALSAKQTDDAYCRDFSTSKPIKSFEKVSCITAWNITR